jgi:hypothetical protein
VQSSGSPPAPVTTMILRIPMSDRFSCICGTAAFATNGQMPRCGTPDWPFNWSWRRPPQNRDAVYATDCHFCLFGLHRELKKGTNLFFRFVTGSYTNDQERLFAFDSAI